MSNTELSQAGNLEQRAVAAAGRSGISRRFSRAFHILKHYRTAQLLIRAWNIARTKVTGKRYSAVQKLHPSPRPTRCRQAFATLAAIKHPHCELDPAECRDLLEAGKIKLLNRTAKLAQSSHETLLWQFQLHYHEFLQPLAAHSKTDALFHFLESWLDQYPMSDRTCQQPAWHPYCISRRLPVWFNLLSSDLAFPAELSDKMLVSAFAQAAFLRRNLEWDLRGNHLLENLRALALAGCFFDEGEFWLSRVRELLPDQLGEQVLEWGEHFETCPMYHCQILGNLLETMIACRDVDPQLHQTLDPIARQMLGFLENICHPDGEIPLLGDSCFGEAPNVSTLMALADAANVQPESPQADSPYWTVRDGNSFLIFDRGQACATMLPAHGHCDLLAIEASLFGQRVFVDSGLFNYDDDSMRAYCRSTLAHNTVMVAGQNQFDVWSKFRMGRRGRVTRKRAGTVENLRWADGFHDAYRHLGVPELGRLFVEKRGQYWYCLEYLDGKKPLDASGFLHFSPRVNVSQVSEFRFEVSFDGKVFDLLFFGTSEVKKTTGWYCPEFGVRQTASVLEYKLGKGMPRVGGWFLCLDSASKKLLPSILTEVGDQQITITLSNPQGVLDTFEWNLKK